MQLKIGYCLLCGQFGELTTGVCDYCDKQIKSGSFSTYTTRSCSKCGDPLLHCDSVCNHRGRLETANIQKVGFYTSYLKELIIRYKFSPCRALAPYLASLISPMIINQNHPPNQIWVVFVPCSPKGLQLRGWDQMEEIAYHLAKIPSIRKMALLERIDFHEQKLKTREQRISGVGGTFALRNLLNISTNTNLPPPVSMVVIDDVYTTGATMHECMKLLQKHFTCLVSGICLAMD